MSHETLRPSTCSSDHVTIKEEQGHSLEFEFVKSTYDAIAEDFSSTRYKKWPKVDAYLRSLPRSSLLLDVGCGNGKYLDNQDTYNIGCDLSLNLLKICKAKGFEVVLCDMTRLPLRPSVFDSVISISALHHLTTTNRRRKCLADMIDLMDPRASSCLIQVWSFEQGIEKHNPYLKDQPNHLQDAMTPPSESLQIDGGLKLPIHKNRTPFQEQDVLVPFHSKSAKSSQDTAKVASSRRLRYYHVFRQAELDEMFHEVADIGILQSYHDKGNWCVVAGKGKALNKGEN